MCCNALVVKKHSWETRGVCILGTLGSLELRFGKVWQSIGKKMNQVMCILLLLKDGSRYV